MTDQKISTNTDQSDIDTLAQVALISPDTGDTSTNLQQLEVTPISNNASYSLERLEQDLRVLHSKWQAVEDEMSERNEQVSELQLELEAARQKTQELEVNLDGVTAEKDSLTEDRTAVFVELDEMKSKCADYDRTILEREDELSAVRGERKSLLKSKEKLENDLARQIDSSTTSDHRLLELESNNAELQVDIQELRSYIDGRKLDWQKLNATIKEYENTIEGISTNLSTHDHVIAEKEEQKAGLALKVMELERQLAEAKGRRLERETSQTELQQSLEVQSRELGSLNGETSRLRKDIDKLRKKLERRDATLSTLRQDLKDRKRDSSTLEGLLSTEKTKISELQVELKAVNEHIVDMTATQKERNLNTDELAVTIGELRERLRLSEPATAKHESQIADLESSLRVNEKTASELRDQVASAGLRLEKMSNEATEHEIRIAELEAMLLESDAEKKNGAKELEAQRELVHILENELSNKQDNLDILDRSADRLSAIGDGIRALDVRIDDHWCEQPKKLFTESDPLFEQPQEVLPQPKELFSDPEELVEHFIVSDDDGSDEPVRYPLTKKELTIGRSRKSDIRINSKFISRIHARIKIEGSTVTIEDAGSTNGFLVNSMHATRHTLTHGDKLEIGKNKFRFLDRSSA